MAYNDELKLTQIDLAALVEATGDQASTDLATNTTNLLAGQKSARQNEADSFGRGRVSLPYQEVDIKFTHDLNPGQMVAIEVGTGAVTHATGDSYAELAVAAADDAATIRTRTPLRYRAGQSLQVVQTFVAPDADVTYRVGYFNATDGLFLQKIGTAISFIIRDSISSTEIDRTQANWSIDSMDGTGPSGVTLDWTKDILFIMDLQFLGIGQIRFGFVVDGRVCWAHWEDFSNQGVAPYMASANLFMSYQVVAPATYAGAGSELRAICGTVIREGGQEEPTSKHTASTAVGTNATPASNTWESVVSIRLKSTYKFNASALPSSLAMFTTSAQAVAWRVMRLSHSDAPAAITGGAWANVGPESICEYSVVETNIDITKGKTFDVGYVASSNQARGSIDSSLFDTDGLGLDASDERDVLILAAAGLGGAGAIQASLQVIEWK